MTALAVVTDAGFEIGPLLHQSRKADAGRGRCSCENRDDARGSRRDWVQFQKEPLGRPPGADRPRRSQNRVSSSWRTRSAALARAWEQPSQPLRHCQVVAQTWQPSSREADKPCVVARAGVGRKQLHSLTMTG